MLSAKDVRRFWAKVAVGGLDECWPWQAGKFTKGYGVFHIGGVPVLAHRVAFQLVRGCLGRKHCLHSCDTPACCNPCHLFGGTNADNVDDKIAKGRQYYKVPAAQRALIVAQRAAGVSARALAASYGVTAATIRNICREAK